MGKAWLVTNMKEEIPKKSPLKQVVREFMPSTFSIYSAFIHTWAALWRKGNNMNTLTKHEIPVCHAVTPALKMTLQALPLWDFVLKHIMVFTITPTHKWRADTASGFIRKTLKWNLNDKNRLILRRSVHETFWYYCAKQSGSPSACGRVTKRCEPCCLRETPLAMEEQRRMLQRAHQLTSPTMASVEDVGAEPYANEQR